jgi:hypothetical protein
MAALAQLAGELRSLVSGIDDGTLRKDEMQARLKRILRQADEVIQRAGAFREAGAEDYRGALQSLAECLRRRESALLDRKLLLASKLRHIRNVNQWAQSSAQTL